MEQSTSSKKQALIAILCGGLALIVVGMLIGLSPASVTTQGGLTYSGTPLSCGSPWSPNHEAIASANSKTNDVNSMTRAFEGVPSWATGSGPQADYAKACSDAFGGRGTTGVLFAVLGALAVLGAALVAANVQGSPPAPVVE